MATFSAKADNQPAEDNTGRTPAASSENEPEKKAGAWTTSSTPALKISEFMFNNWSSSGNSQIDVTATFFGNYKYTHPKYVWDNIADLAYGYAWQNLDPEDDTYFETRRKSNDKIDLTRAMSTAASGRRRRRRRFRAFLPRRT